MALLLGCCAPLVCVILQWFAGMAAANEKTIPVWTWVDGSMLLNQPSTLTAGKQYPGCRAASSIWTHPERGVSWMFGGREGSGSALSELWLYDMPSLEWTSVRRGKEEGWPTPRYGAALCGLASSSLVLYGGASGTEGNLLSDTWLYHLHNKSWTVLEDSRLAHKSIIAHWCTSDALWFYEGAGSELDSAPVMRRLSLPSLQWEDVNADNGRGKSTEGNDLRPGAASWVVNKTQLYLFGGKLSPTCESCQGNGSKGRDDCSLWQFSTTARDWEHVVVNFRDRDRRYADGEAVELAGRPSCSAQAASWIDAENNLWLLTNGEGSNSTSELWMFDLRISSWTHFRNSGSAENQSQRNQISEGMMAEGANTRPPPRTSCASWSWNSTFYLFGGLARNGSVGALNDLWEMQLVKADRLHSRPTDSMAVPPVAVFFMSLGALCVLSLFVFSVIFLSKCSSGPRLKPPNHFGDKIRYSPVETDDVFIT